MNNEPNTTDDFEESLKKKFDDLLAEMNQPGFAEGVERALFGDTETLIKAYHPGETGTQE